MAPKSSRNSLPFEPAKSRKKQGKKSSASPKKQVTEKQNHPQNIDRDNINQNAKRARGNNSIPEVVSRRMITRMVLLSGTPLLFSVLTFVFSYFIIANDIFVLPNQAVLLVSTGFFGLSVVGLSYGLFSASWDEDKKGSLLGLQEVKINFQRMREAWKEAKSKN
ncbi:PAM68 family protein [Okeania sp.]|uniref:PAM68 family protein n=1 Tax=Okeania sp. TaxID=3100323 RepID=UPI002B4AD49D|nr:PAM68 family protein [Okeania sp.]MEB3343045.1 PAM68 family protein [Okeania sp.]